MNFVACDNNADEWLRRLETQRVFSGIGQSIDLSERSLNRLRALVQQLGVRFSVPVIVVGGTNGKGSTCAMLDSILRAGGYRVARYSSPHLLRFNERALINGREASDQALIEHFEAVAQVVSNCAPLTYFEFTTLAILRLFASQDLDAVILEVGLGGRLDAVNAIDSDCAIVTSIDLDHTVYLGDTREAIGFEKAHIFRAGKPAICCDPQPPDSVLAVANELGADVCLFGRDFNYRGVSYGAGPVAKAAEQWSFAGRRQRRNSLPYPALRGANQLLNASGALAALEALSHRLPLSQQAVRQGLLSTTLPARFQVLPGQPTIVLDVAHNPHAAAVLAQNLDSQGYFARTHAVLGMLADKDIRGVVNAVRGRIDVWHLGPTGGERGLCASGLAALVRDQILPSVPVHQYPSVTSALKAARMAAATDDRIIAFGSFVSVAEVMRALEDADGQSAYRQTSAVQV